MPFDAATTSRAGLVAESACFETRLAFSGRILCFVPGWNGGVGRDFVHPVYVWDHELFLPVVEEGRLEVMLLIFVPVGVMVPFPGIYRCLTIRWCVEKVCGVLS